MLENIWDFNYNYPSHKGGLYMKSQEWFCEGCHVIGTLEYPKEQGDVMSVAHALNDHHRSVSPNCTQQIRIVNPDYVPSGPNDPEMVAQKTARREYRDVGKHRVASRTSKSAPQMVAA